MARPTDPEKLAALRARQAANSRAYRARKKAEREAARAATPPKPRAAPSSEQAVQRAHERRAAAKSKRNAFVGTLTSARNPAVKIHTPRDIPTAPANIPGTAPARRQRIKVLREHTNAQKLQNIGRERKRTIAATLSNDPRAGSLRENLSKVPGGVARFQAAVKRMSAVSQQTLAIFMQYEGGEGDFQSVLTQIAYPKATDVEDSLGRIETLAEQLERAEDLYGPKALGKRVNL